MTSATMRDGQLGGSGVLPNLYEDDELSCAFRFMFGKGPEDDALDAFLAVGFSVQFLAWLF